MVKCILIRQFTSKAKIYYDSIIVTNDIFAKYNDYLMNTETCARYYKLV